MQRLQAYKFELKPNGEQQRSMRRFAGSCRFVFNKALALQKERHEQGEKKLSYAERLMRALVSLDQHVEVVVRPARRAHEAGIKVTT